MKAYNKFTDKFGNQYGFDNYMDFAKWWFNMPSYYLKSAFPEYKKLQRAASSSKEARTPMF